MGNPVVHFDITAPDAAKAREFYGELFGWSYNVMPEMNYSLVDTAANGQGIAGGIGEGEPSVTVYIEVPDPQAALDKAVALGATVTQPVDTIPGGMVTLAMFRDPQGLNIGLVKNHQ